MSGVIIKMGVYGLVRVTSLLPHPPLEWGVVVLGLGVVSGVLGVAYAIGQHDLKRLLAYHSIENIGIIVMGLGLALLGRSLGRPDWVVLGLGGGLLHVWNHALFKALLFLSAGSVIHATHTREIDHLGGLAKRMPRDRPLLPGRGGRDLRPAAAQRVRQRVPHLPGPLPHRSAAAAGPSFAVAAFAVPALALIGALAVACFVKVYGAVFLGRPSDHARHAHEAPGRRMLVPMAVLVACCLFIGLGSRAWSRPSSATGGRGLGTRTSAGAAPARSAGPARAGSRVMGLALLAALLAVGAVVLAARPRPAVAEGATWGCGYVAPDAADAVHVVLLRPDAGRPLRAGRCARGRASPSRHCRCSPARRGFHSEVPDAVLDEAVLPAFRVGAWLFSWFRGVPAGSIQTYLLYIFLALLAPAALAIKGTSMDAVTHTSPSTCSWPWRSRRCSWG